MDEDTYTIKPKNSKVGRSRRLTDEGGNVKRFVTNLFDSRKESLSLRLRYETG